LIDAIDYQTAVSRITEAASSKQPLAVSALAVHGLMIGALDREQKYRLNHFDLLVPDGQPVRWALNAIHKTHLRDRVYGPNLTLAVCARAEARGLGLFFYGSTPDVLARLKLNLQNRFPSIRISGMEHSKFRSLTLQEKQQIVERIHESGAEIVFVGLGCPRQEVWTYELRDAISRPVLAVGAAFPFLAGTLRQAPEWMQERGLEWLFRLFVEPRLWRRYLFLNPAYILLILSQLLRLHRFSTDGHAPSTDLSYG
jgi:exopolysaccharide biosynthesis WecB/TagA/CpsF family protein